MKKTGFIAIVGRANVGKSTLLNALLGMKVAIVSEKPQTTRNRIAGIETRGENQFVFEDTPGLFHGKSALDDFMVKTADATLKDSDIVLFVADAGYRPGDIEENIIAYLNKSKKPCILVLNKIDLCNRETLAKTITEYASKCDFAAVLPVSAKKKKYVDDVYTECEKFLHEGEWFYESDDYTDQTSRQMASEIIREKILRTTNQEIPHGAAVVIEEYKFDDAKDILNIRAEIFVERESHKGIVVGKNGEELKRIGTYAREDIEKLTGAKVYLDLWVKVKENWRDDNAIVMNFGYRDD